MVCQGSPVFCKSSWMYRAGLRYSIGAAISAYLHCYYGIWVSPKIGVLPSGTMSQTLNSARRCLQHAGCSAHRRALRLWDGEKCDFVARLLLHPSPDRWANYCDQLLYVCLSARVSRKPYVRIAPNFLCMFPVARLGPPLTTMQYVMYFRFCCRLYYSWSIILQLVAYMWEPMKPKMLKSICWCRIVNTGAEQIGLIKVLRSVGGDRPVQPHGPHPIHRVLWSALRNTSIGI